MIELDRLTVRFGRKDILQDLTHCLPAPTIGLLGPNGAGKTTLLHTLLGFHRPASGRAAVCGLDVARESRQIRRLIGYMPESDSFVSGMTAVRFLRLMAELTGIPREAALERAHEALFYVGLGEARYRRIETFSTGMKQVVKLAQAIVHGPRILFLDEPTNGLDPPARQRMIALIRDITRSEGIGLVLSSHLLRDVEECCEDVLILKEGRIAAYCNLKKQSSENRQFVEVETLGEHQPFLAVLEERGCAWAQAGPSQFKMVLPENWGVKDIYQTAEAAGVQLRRLNYKRESLEEIFLKAMGADGGGL